MINLTPQLTDRQILSVTVGLVLKPLKDLSPFLAKLKASGIAFSEAPIGPPGRALRI